MSKRALFFAIILLFGFSTLSFAQGPGRMSPADRTKQLTDQLKLNKDQAKKVEGIYTKQQDEMTVIFESGQGFGDPATRDKMMALRDSTNNKIMKLLTKDQQTEFKKILEEQRKRMEEQRQNRGN